MADARQTNSDSVSVGHDFTTPAAVEDYAEQLVGMTFRDILDLGIKSPHSQEGYGRRGYKGGWGVLLEERFFGYDANSSPEPDLPEAGVEIKSSPIDRRRDGSLVAGERISLEAISYSDEMPKRLEESRLWHKCRRLLLVWYLRDKSLDDPYQQRIYDVGIYTPPQEDLKIIEADYTKIASIVRAGHAEELSESLTTYLGAATTGSGHGKMVPQRRYGDDRPAKPRRWSFKNSYTRYILDTHFLNRTPKAERIVKDASSLSTVTFEDYVLGLTRPYVGKTDRELCGELGLHYSGNKAQWSTIAYRTLGIRSNRAEEFEKAGVNVRSVRVEPDGHVRESLVLLNVDFSRIADTPWDESPLRRLLDETRFYFTVFATDKATGMHILAGSFFWSMPQSDLDGEVRRCYEETQRRVREGVLLMRVQDDSGGVIVTNDLPKADDNAIAHVRPRAQRRAYRFADGTTMGNVERDAVSLPDGRAMTRQAFWLNGSYVTKIVARGLSSKANGGS